MKSVENMIKDYWNKTPGAEEELYNYFTPKVKQISYGIFNRNKDISYDVDDYFQAGYLGIFKACDIYREKGFPEDIEASMYIIIKYNILRQRQKINNKKGAFLESLDKTEEDAYNLSELLGDENSLEPHDLIEKRIDDNTLRKELNFILKTKFNRLTSEIIKMKYGWNDYPRTDDYIAEELGMESSKVASIHTKALCRFRNLEWTKQVGTLYLYGYKMKNIKKQMSKDIRKPNDQISLKLYSNALSEGINSIKEKDIKSIWGL